jgi:hypothetical protein
MQFDDTTFQLLRELRIGGGRISFVLPRGGRRFDGSITDTMMAGTVQGSDGSRANWVAFPMGSESKRWPVPPRVTVRQLAMGTSAASERIPGAWIARLPDTSALERDDRELARLAGMPPASRDDRVVRWRRLTLGFDEAGRTAARNLLARIAQGPAADPMFQAIFRQGAGWRIDIHDALPGAARHFMNGFELGRAVRGLRQLGALPEGADSATIREVAWRLWCRAAVDSADVFARVNALGKQDPDGADAIRAMLAGFDDAAEWWRTAVRWLLTHAWLDTPSGPRSPAQLMAAFWDVDSLPMPDLLLTRTGDIAALPVVAAAHIGPYLLNPRNASAAEWLAHDGTREAFDVWLPIKWGELPLTVVAGGRSEIMVSPRAQAEARPAAFFGARDAIRVEAGIMPIAAVVTFLHEWHHLIAAQRRLTGTHPSGLRSAGPQVELLEADPWLGEGFAEWATEETLRPAGANAALLRFTQAEKRLGNGARDPDEPHLLGYRLMLAAAAHSSPSASRDRFVRTLHDPALLARELGLAGPSRTAPRVLSRPPNAAVIPEVTFTWDEGLAFDVSRRLLIITNRPEH